MKLLGRIALGLLALLVVAYLGAVTYMYVNQRALQYDVSGSIIALADSDIVGAEDFVLPVDGGEVHGWYRAPDAGKPLIVYYRGNSKSFSEQTERYRAWANDGYGFVAFDYRGFPASPGELNQTNILADSLLVYDWAAEKGFPLVVWGWSLGSGPAAYVSSLRQPLALLLETPFLSAVTVAAERYPILPVYWVMQDQFPNNEWITKVTAPVFVAHGTADRTIDVSNGERLYALAPNKDELWIVPGADHADMLDAGLWDKAKAFFDRARGI